MYMKFLSSISYPQYVFYSRDLTATVARAIDIANHMDNVSACVLQGYALPPPVCLALHHSTF